MHMLGIVFLFRQRMGVLVCKASRVVVAVVANVMTTSSVDGVFRTQFGVSEFSMFWGIADVRSVGFGGDSSENWCFSRHLLAMYRFVEEWSCRFGRRSAGLSKLKARLTEFRGGNEEVVKEK
jgi:hypothetical protein